MSSIKSSVKSKAIDLERKALKYEFHKASHSVEARIKARLAVLAKTHPKLSSEQLHELARKDPKYASDVLLYKGMYDLYKAADKKLEAKEGATKVGSGFFDSLKTHDDILKRLEAVKHDKDHAKGHDASEKKSAEHKPSSLSASKDHHAADHKATIALIQKLRQEHSKSHLPHPHVPHSAAKPHLAHHNASTSLNLGKPSGGWAALFAKLQKPKQPEHATIKEDDGASVASSWVSATSVGVVVAMCACVAAFAVVRRRQRQSESAAPRVDGYATLV